jgi:predicted membrane protein DUF2339
MPAPVLILLAASPVIVAVVCLVMMVDIRRRVRYLERRVFAAELELFTSRSPFRDPATGEPGPGAAGDAPTGPPPAETALDPPVAFQRLRRRRSRGRLGRVAVGVGGGALTLAVALFRPPREAAVVWSVEALTLLVAGIRQERRWVRVAALGVFALAGLAWLATGLGASRPRDFLVGSPALVPTLVLAGACALGAWVDGRARRGADSPRDPESWARAGLALAAILTPALLVTRELSLRSGMLAAEANVASVLLWAAAASLALALAPSDRTPLLATASAALLLVAGTRAVLGAHGWSTVAASLAWPVLNPRFLAGLLIVGVYLAWARLVPRLPVGTDGARARLHVLAATTAVILLVWNLSAEVTVMALAGAPRGELTGIRSVALTLLWAAVAAVALVAGIRRRERRLRLAALVVLALAVARALVIDVGRLV